MENIHYMAGLKVVAIGGGTGLSTMLKGLRLYTDNITAVVTVADDGGSSGLLRHDFGMLPPGDVRNCLSALTDVNPELGELLNFRFSDGTLKGHSLGNIILAALNETSDTFDGAVKKMSALLGIVGRVYPVTNDDVTLRAILTNGNIIDGESKISQYKGAMWNRIKRIELVPDSAKAVKGVITAIEEADIIVFGPGSLYTSIIPNLLVDGVLEAIQASVALKIYVCNIMTQKGETEGYSASEHLDALEAHSYKGIADIMIVNNATIPDDMAKAYSLENAQLVHIDSDKIIPRVKLMQGNLVLIQDGKVRHNFSRLARAIMNIGRDYIELQYTK